MTNPVDSQTRNRNGVLTLQGDQYIKSNMSADPDYDGDNDSSAKGDTDNDRGAMYGQNGYTGASSDLPGQHTCSGFLPECKLPADAKGSDWQTRKVNAGGLPKAYGMKTPAVVKMSTVVSHRR